MTTGIDQAKQAIRTRVWDLLVAERVVEPGVHGYIPAFTGGTIKRVAVDVSGDPYLNLEREAQAMLARE